VLHGDPSDFKGRKPCLPKPTAGAGLHESGWCLHAHLLRCCRAELRRRVEKIIMPAGNDPSVTMAHVCKPPRRAAARQASGQVAQGSCGGPQPGEGMPSGSESDEKHQGIGSSDVIPKGLFLQHTETSTVGGEHPRLLFLRLFRVHQFSSLSVFQRRRHPLASSSTYLT